MQKFKKRKHRRTGDVALAVAAVVLTVVVSVQMVKSLDHPGEQHISGSEHMAQIAQHAPKQTVVEPKELPSPAEEPALYDVPLDDDLQLHIIATCEAYHVDPAIVLAQIGLESTYHADSIGDDGNAYGLMQIWPYWHYDHMQELGCTDLLDPYQNVVVGIDYLAECIDRYDGDVAKGLVAYNGGHYAGEVTEYAKSVMEFAETLRKWAS